MVLRKTGMPETRCPVFLIENQLSNGTSSHGSLSLAMPLRSYAHLRETFLKFMVRLGYYWKEK
jgi:hypothetical protein